MTTKELKEAGINFDNLVYPNGEMNIIVQQFGIGDNEDLEFVYPDIYQPRQNAVYSHGNTNVPISLVTDKDKADYAKHLLDSSERLKIMSLLLAKQAQELKDTGKIITDCYYPEGSDWYELAMKSKQ